MKACGVFGKVDVGYQKNKVGSTPTLSPSQHTQSSRGGTGLNFQSPNQGGIQEQNALHFYPLPLKQALDASEFQSFGLGAETSSLNLFKNGITFR